MERFEMACRIAAAQIDVTRVRRARCAHLSTMPVDDTALVRAAMLDRYERRALSRRNAAAPLASEINEEDCVRRSPEIQNCREPIPSEMTTIPVNSRRLRGREPMPDQLAKRTQGKSTPRRTNPKQSRQIQVGAADAIFAGRTRRDPVTAARLGRTNPTGTGRLASIPPNEPEECSSGTQVDWQHFAPTNNGCACRAD